ncbi:hypothetical protein F5B20DRAFT_579026 [Whalleya microplaca]|nr:hypothetical protein F5B20DRAFT_579026 [Whalleya microplaca]
MSRMLLSIIALAIAFRAVTAYPIAFDGNIECVEEDTCSNMGVYNYIYNYFGEDYDYDDHHEYDYGSGYHYDHGHGSSSDDYDGDHEYDHDSGHHYDHDHGSSSDDSAKDEGSSDGNPSETRTTKSHRPRPTHKA